MRARQRHFNPAHAGATLEVDARFNFSQSDGSTISTWTGRSPSAINATQATPANQPLYEENEIGGQPALSFDGSNDALVLSSNALFQNVPGAFVLSVASYTTTSGARTILNAAVGATGGDGAVRVGMLANIVGGQFHANARRLDGNAGAGLNGSSFSANEKLMQANLLNFVAGTQAIRKNGTQAANNTLASSGGNTSNTASQRIRIGANSASNPADPPQFMSGLIAKVSVLPFAPTSSLIKRVEHAAAFSFKIACN
jgi:hypothetical protein